MSEQSNSKRIAKNTLMLYFRQILIMLVSLYTVRVVLNVLGAEDYGIYNVVAGVVTMFSFLGSSMATASQRYFSYDLGNNDYESLTKTFSVMFEIFLVLGFFIIIFAETIGLWFVNSKLIIPENRIFSANVIYQAAIISFLFTLITTPYMALIIAHENMNVYAYVSIIEVFLKLLIVLLLKVFLFDKLVTYGILLTVVAGINTSIYRFYCKKKYKECNFRLICNKKLFFELVSYSGWNLFGASVGVVKNQIINILLNLKFGPLVNAARGISAQVSTAVISFGQNFSTALRPQVIKNYANGNEDVSLDLVYKGCKLTFFLMWFITLPLLLETEFVLTLWLKTIPDYVVLFTKLILIDCLIDCLNYQIMTLAQATGKIKLYQSVVGGILLGNLPVSLLVLKLGGEPFSVLIVSICITVIAMVTRLMIVRKITSFSTKSFLIRTLLPCFIVVIVSSVIPCIIKFCLASGYIRFLVVFFSSIMSIIIAVFLCGLNMIERKEIISVIRGKMKK